MNLETLVGYRVDAIVNVGTASTDFNSASTRALAERVGAPLWTLVARDPYEMPALFEQLGRLTGSRARGRRLGEEATRIVERAAAVARRVDPRRRRRVYYAEGLKGLNTEPRGSVHAELLEFVGAENVAAIANGELDGFGNTPVSLEQVVAWDPEVIFVSDYLGPDGGRAGWRSIFESNPLWRRVTAVREGRVHIVPRSPFQWLDRPPSVNRLAGLVWLPALLYPEFCDYSLRDEIRRFYAEFYHHELSDRALSELLDTAIPPNNSPPSTTGAP